MVIWLTTINIVDMPMGTGKTCAAINYMNEHASDKKFMFVTPYLDEAQRIVDCCPYSKFEQPQVYGNKLNGLKYLLEHGRNVSITHALFGRFDQEVREAMEHWGYTLIMDEVAQVIDSLRMTKKDWANIIAHHAHVEGGNVIWDDLEYRGAYEKYMKVAVNQAMVYDEQTSRVFWSLPVDTFKTFEDIYVLTYMFDAQIQKYYYDLHDLDYRYIGVAGDAINNYYFTESPVQKPLQLKKLIRMNFNEKMDQIGKNRCSLSKSWYQRQTGKNNEVIRTLKNNTRNFIYDICAKKSGESIWTTFTTYQKKIQSRGFIKDFVPLNARATNLYGERDCVVYLVNRYLDPTLVRYFNQRNVTIDQDKYALSEMLQFIWRSAIRNKKPIDLYMPSKRMRTLFVKWMEQQESLATTTKNKICQRR